MTMQGEASLQTRIPVGCSCVGNRRDREARSGVCTRFERRYEQYGKGSNELHVELEWCSDRGNRSISYHIVSLYAKPTSTQNPPKPAVIPQTQAKHPTVPSLHSL